MGKKADAQRGLSDARLARALGIIEARLGEQLSVEEIARAAHLSAYHFTRMFRRSTGLSPHAYLTKRRMEVARELLAATDRPLAQIAAAVGYRTQAHFTHVFRQENDLTPRAFRLKARRAQPPGG